MDALSTKATHSETTEPNRVTADTVRRAGEETYLLPADALVDATKAAADPRAGIFWPKLGSDVYSPTIQAVIALQLARPRYTATFAAAQILDFADLVRGITAVDAPRITDAQASKLHDFLQLLPEVSTADQNAWLNRRGGAR